MHRATAAPPDDKPSTAREVFDFMPSWLVSLVVHLSLVLLLAVFQVVGEGGWSDGIVLDCSTSESDGDNAMLSATLEVPSELDAPQELPQDVEPVSLEPQPTVAAIDLIEPAGVSGASVAAALGGEVGDARAETAKTAVFGLAAEGETFVYVFDRSESMNSTLTYESEGTTVFSVTPLAAAKAELLRSLGDLGPNQQFHIVFYNHEVWMFDPGRVIGNRLVVASNKNKRRAESFVRSVYGHGNTQHLKPLEIALKMRPDVIFLLTDGEAKDDPTPAQLKRLRRLNDGRTKINVIQFCYTTRTDGSLVELANENGGRHIFFNITRLGPGMASVGK